MLNGYLMTAGWRDVGQVMRIERQRRVKGTAAVEVAYFVTSLTRDEADAERLLALIRSHWEIENRLHYVRDVTLGEDACRVRTGSSPQVLATRRNTVVHPLEGIEAPSKAAAMRRFAAHPGEAIQLINT